MDRETLVEALARRDRDEICEILDEVRSRYYDFHDPTDDLVPYMYGIVIESIADDDRLEVMSFLRDYFNLSLKEAKTCLEEGLAGLHTPAGLGQTGLPREDIESVREAWPTDEARIVCVMFTHPDWGDQVKTVPIEDDDLPDKTTILHHPVPIAQANT